MIFGIYNFTPQTVGKTPQLAFRANEISLEEFNKTFLEALGLRHIATMNHSYRTALYAEELARALNYDEKRVQVVKTAALLHDTGKIKFKDSFYLQQGTKEDGQDYEKHPFLGRKLLENSDFLKKHKIPEIVNQHHINYDGSGFPNGLKDENILPEARILKIVDTFDSITLDKYNGGQLIQPLDQAIQELEEKSGKNLDPEMTKVFVGLVKEKGLFYEVKSKTEDVSEQFRKKYNLPVPQSYFPQPPLPLGTRYRQNLVNKLNKVEGTDYTVDELSAVMGPRELQRRLQTAAPINFNPEYADSGHFNINLHTHTTASDGKYTPETLFASVRNQVKKMREKGRKEDFVVSITDHHHYKTAQSGLVDALKYIAEETRKDPHAFDGIKFVPGQEFLAIYENPNFLKEPVKLEILVYGMDPFKDYGDDEDMSNYWMVDDLLKEEKGALLSVAHPIRIDFKDKVKKDVFKDSDLPVESQALQEFFKDFKAKGGHAAEANYYIDPNEQEAIQYLPETPVFDTDDRVKDIKQKGIMVSDLCEKAGLLKSGGIDNHGTNFYNRN